MATEIVKIDASNAVCLDSMAPEVFDFPVRPDYLLAFLSDPRHVLIVAIDDGCVVGMATAFEYFHPDKPPQMFINEVGVSPGWQRKGLGRKLTAALVEEAERRGCQYAWLGTESQNIAAQKCFASVPEAEGPKTFLLYEWDMED
ncbi:MAG: GNAT family N-acetyltransferase [Hyphomonas sp.]|nr:GNAT family N-acetyltransferase [Hyphomonas sp.]